MAEEKMMGVEAQVVVKELRDEFESGKSRSYEWRVKQLKGILRMIKERRNDVVEALRVDLCKPEYEAVVFEISVLKTSCELAIRKLKSWMKPKKLDPGQGLCLLDPARGCASWTLHESAALEPSSGLHSRLNVYHVIIEQVWTSLITFPSSASIVPEPLGVVLVISTWNYPFLMSLDPVVGAIAAGNVVVLKPSEIAPSTSSFLAEWLHKYVDSTCVRVVEGSVPQTRALLDQKWDKIFYTGSGRIGKIVMAAASRHLTPVALELGGKCPAVVDPDVNLKLAAGRIAAGKWGCNNGQTCISPDYLITTRDFAPKLIDAIRSTLERSYGKDLLGCEGMSRIVNVQHFTRLTDLLSEEGVSGKIVWGGESDQKQLKIAPTILLDVPESSSIMSEEIFGPLLPIVTVECLEESFQVIKSKPKPLAAYLFTNNKHMKKKFISNISAGGILINDTILHFTLNSLPFGGVGESGMGSYHGKFSFDTFSHKKAVLSKSFCFDVGVRYPPYTRNKARTLDALSSNNMFHKAFGLMRVSKDLVM